MDGSNEFNLSWGPLDDVVMGGASESKINVGTSFGGLWTGIGRYPRVQLSYISFPLSEFSRIGICSPQ